MFIVWYVSMIILNIMQVTNTRVSFVRVLVILYLRFIFLSQNTSISVRALKLCRMYVRVCVYEYIECMCVCTSIDGIVSSHL